MLETALDVIRSVFTVDFFTASVVGLLTVWAGTLLRNMTDSTGLAVAITPVVYIGAMISIYLFREYGVVFVYEKKANTVASASTGMILSLLIMLLATRMVYKLSARSQTGLEDRMTDEG